MSFYVFFLSGILGGILGGMGMGGGTALIPLLTIFCGVEQTAAQGVNLLSFLPMSAVALSVHAKNGLLESKGLLPLIAPALAFSALFSFAATLLPSVILGKGFGVFLIVLSFFRLAALFRKKEEKKSEKE